MQSVKGTVPAPTTAAHPPVSVHRNVAANYVGRAYSMGANFLFIPFYVAILGVESYGVIAFYAVLLAITALADIGLSATFSREAARQTDPRQLIRLLATAEKILLAGVCGCSLLILTGAGWIAEHWFNGAGTLGIDEVAWSLRLMALMLIPQLMVTFYSAGLLGLQRQIRANVIQSLFITVRAGLVIPLILWRPDLTVFFGWQLLATLIFAVVTRIVLVRSMGLGAFARGPFDWSILRPHLPYAGGLAAITIISGINTQLDKVLISRLFTLAEFGYYNIASTLAQLPIAGAMPIAVAFFPRLVASVANDDVGERRRIHDQFGRLVAFVAALGAFGLALFAPELLAVWLQDSLPAVVPHVAATLAIGSLFMCLNLPSYYLCLAHGRSWLVVIVAAVTLAVSVPVALITIPAFGLLGGALTWLLLNLINLVLLTIAANRLSDGAAVLASLRRTPITLSIALLPLLAARLFANSIGATPLISCVVAASAAAISVIVFALIWRRSVLTPVKL